MSCVESAIRQEVNASTEEKSRNEGNNMIERFDGAAMVRQCAECERRKRTAK
jgi:hypothetical protein